MLLLSHFVIKDMELVTLLVSIVDGLMLLLGPVKLVLATLLVALVDVRVMLLLNIALLSIALMVPVVLLTVVVPVPPSRC